MNLSISVFVIRSRVFLSPRRLDDIFRKKVTGERLMWHLGRFWRLSSVRAKPSRSSQAKNKAARHKVPRNFSHRFSSEWQNIRADAIAS